MSAACECRYTRPTAGARWAGPVIAAATAILAFTVQWGVVTAKLDQVEKRLDELIVEARSTRSEARAIERRVAYLEGIHGRTTSGGSETP